MTAHKRIRLTGDLANYFGPDSEHLVLVCDAITTEDRFENHWEEDSLAHAFFRDGVIMRYQQVIGHTDQIEYIDEAKESRQ